MTCEQAKRHHTSPAATLLGLFGTKKGKPTPHSTPIWRMWTYSLAKRRSRTWTSNLPLRQQSPDNPSFDYHLVIPNRALVEWMMDKRVHRTLLLPAPIGLRAPTTWHMPHEIPGVFHMLFDTAEALASVTWKKLPK